MNRLCLLVLIMLCALPARAQTPLDPAAQPEFGGLVLAPGFQPDPQRAPVVLVGGGEVDVIGRALGPDCLGFIGQAPDFRVSLTAPADLLRFIFIADAVTSDSAMVLALPDGRYLCGNNYAGLLNPLVDVQPAPAGDYAVWIAGFTPGAQVFGTLYLTGSSGVVPESAGLFIPPAAAASAGTPTPAPGTFLDAVAPPAHGSEALEHGFLPDPFWTLAIGGGFLAVPSLDGNPAPASACAGFTSGEPDFRLSWSGASPRLRFHFLPASAAGAAEPDAALIVRGPDGAFRCNRDFAPGFTRPSVEVISPPPGDYAVWVAVESAPGDLAPGLLYITELQTTPETLESAAAFALDSLSGPDPAAAGPALLFDFSASDPIRSPLSADQIGPGTVDLAALNPAALAPDGQRLCEGFVSPQPTMMISLPQAFPYLRVFFIASDPAQDTVMVLRMPDGRWYCSDDALGTLNPQVDVLGSMAAGVAQVWIGGFEAGARVSGTLYATRGQASVVQPDAAFDSSGLAAFSASLPPTPDPMQPPALPSTEPVIQNALPTPEGAQAFAASLLDPYAATNYGEVTLISAAAPHTIQAIAGGSVDASALGGGCVGWVSANADYRVYWSGGFSTLRFFFVGEADSTLIVLGPDGTLQCNDDSFGSIHPTVDFAAAQPGAYHVWLGSFTEGGTALGTLTVTEDLSRSPVAP